MFRNYLKIGIRNIIRYKLFTFINICGLGFGLACCLLIGIYIQNELSYDRFHKNSENIFRILVEQSGSTGSSLRAITPRYLSSSLEEAFPEIESASQFRAINKIVGYNDKEFQNTHIVFTDPAFFNVFSFPVISGSKTDLLADANSAVLTKSFAEKIFGKEEPVGKSFQVKLDYSGNTIANLQVAAVIEDVPQNSHLHFELVASYSLLVKPQRTGIISWGLSEVKTYIKLNENADIKSFESKLEKFVENTGGNQNQIQRKLLLQPLTSIHLASVIPFDDADQTNIRDIYIFAGIALLVLFIACINYVILITARYTQRIKEIGIRKIIGASSGKLTLQFFIEAILMALLALPVAFVIVDISYKGFGELLSKELNTDYISNISLLWNSLALLVFFALAAGLYPAFFFGRISSIASIKGRISGLTSTNKLRKSLIVTQFSITITLLICIGIMYMQLQYTRSKDLGYKKKNIIVVETSALGQQAESFKQSLLFHSAVKSATLTGWLPGFLPASSSMKNPNGEGIIETEFVVADCDLIKTFQIRLLKGRDFNCSNQNDILDPYMSGDVNSDMISKVSIILNETAVRELGLSSPIGMELNYSALQGTVVGVVKDMHHLSLHDPIKPMVIQYSNYPQNLALSYQSDQESEVLQLLNKEWKQSSAKSELNFFFLDDHLRKLYNEDEKLTQMIGWFSTLAIILSCLGLLGLTTFTAERRTKEIGIRKVLGATVVNIITLISKDFIILILLANLIAWPVGWYAMNNWLQNFAYRIEIDFGVFALASFASMIIALATVSFQAVKAAVTNPVKSLRYE